MATWPRFVALLKRALSARSFCNWFHQLRMASLVSELNFILPPQSCKRFELTCPWPLPPLKYRPEPGPPETVHQTMPLPSSAVRQSICPCSYPSRTGKNMALFGARTILLTTPNVLWHFQFVSRSLSVFLISGGFGIYRPTLCLFGPPPKSHLRWPDETNRSSMMSKNHFSGRAGQQI